MENIGRHEEMLRLIGGKIAYYRKLKGFSQKDLACRAGIGESYLKNAERAAVENLSVITLLDIADGLDVPVEMLLGKEKAQ